MKTQEFPDIIKDMLYLIFSLLLIYVLIMFGMYVFQRKIVFQAEKAQLNPESFGAKDMKKYQINTQDDEKITVWYHENNPESGKPVIIYLHGNAGHIGYEYRVQRLNSFTREGYGVLAVSYRGYGDSEGSPSEQALYKDGHAAVEFLHNTHGISYDNIVVFGESLGSGVAVELATKYDFKAIMLDSPYTSTVNRAKEIYPWLPVSLLMKDRFESYKKVGNITSSLIIMHGDLDQVIPIEHGKKLLEYANEPKVGIFLRNVGHVEVGNSEILKALQKI